MRNIREQKTKNGIMLQGYIDKIIFRNDESFFTVAAFIVNEEEVIVNGELYRVVEGDRFSLNGQWVVHPKYGRQFRFTDYTQDLPITEEGMILYLQSGVISGVGPVMARRIVNKFGLQALKIIERSPELLQQIEGVGHKTAQKIATSLQENRAVENLMVFLRGYGISVNQALKIYQTYGDSADRYIRDNPYRLAEDVRGVGFRLADRIALDLGINKESYQRLEAVVKHTLITASRRGHVFLPLSLIVKEATQLLGETGNDTGLDQEEIRTQILALDAQGELVIEPDGSVYLTSFWKAEDEVAEKLIYWSRIIPKSYPADLDIAIDQARDAMGIEFTEEQVETIRRIMQSSITVLTGGPGTGKTTIVRGIIETLNVVKPNAKILLAAPTGRAAKRLSEVCGKESKTIHRLLGSSFVNGVVDFAFDAQNQLKGDILIIDEFSMLDIFLARYLFDAVPEGMRVVIVGDNDQLPSVGPGNVLSDIIESDTVPLVRLLQVFRQNEGSSIVYNAHRINQGKRPRIEDEDFGFVPVREQAEAAKMIARLAVDLLNDTENLLESQVLCATYKQEAGCDNLNQLIRSLYNPLSELKPQMAGGGRVYGLGDKVMQIRNNYDKGVFNGNIGQVVEVIRQRVNDEIHDYLAVNFGNAKILYSKDELEELTLAYAITVHKSQGSEFNSIIMPSFFINPALSTRNLLYTAITRAKKQVIMVGSKQDLNKYIWNNRVGHRYTKLKERLELYAQSSEG